jgi:hypothetical protein
MRGAFLEAILRWSSRAGVAEIRHAEVRSQGGETRTWRRGARGRGSHPRTREALGARPRPLRGAAFDGWTGWDEGERKLSGCDRAVRLDQSQPGRTGPGTEIAAKWSAGRCLSPIARREWTPPASRRFSQEPQGARSQGPRACRRSIPSFSGMPKGKSTRACPGPTARTRAMSHVLMRSAV